MTVRGWHVNPDTGEPGLCRAEISCRFGGDDLHFDTEDDARKFYEAKMSDYTLAELISKSEERSPWRSLSWPDRKEILREYTSELVVAHSKLRRKNPHEVWEPVVNDDIEVLGFADDKKSIIHLTEGAEALEELTVKTLIVHELAHLLEKNSLWRSAEDHGSEWKTLAQSTARGSAILDGIAFSKESNQSVLEKLRRQTQKILARVPRYLGRCSSMGHGFYADKIPKSQGCPRCREDSYDLESRISWSDWIPGSQDEKDYIEILLGKVGFGKENQP